MEASTTLTSGTPGSEGKVRRGWRLTKIAWTLIRRDHTMLLLAFIGVAFSTAISLLVLYFAGYFSPGGRHHNTHFGLIALVAYYPAILVGIFFNVALACAASAALDDEPMGAREAIRIAFGKRRQIAAWALITAVIGAIIAQIASRLPGGGRIVGWLAGAAWGLATIFVVPMLAMEGVGAGDAAKRSASIVKARWGEGLTGTVAIGGWAAIVSIPLCVVAGAGLALTEKYPAPGFSLLAFAIVGGILLSTVAVAARQVFAVALYRFAIDAPTGGFAPADLENPFTGRAGRKSWILRIGVPILVLFAVLFVAFAIFGHHRRDDRSVEAAARGEFSLYHSVGNAPHLPIGTPVLFHGWKIGAVVGTTRQDGTVYNNFRVDPRFSSEMRAGRGHVSLRGSEKVICIGSGRECPRHLPPSLWGRRLPPAAPPT